MPNLTRRAFTLSAVTAPLIAGLPIPAVADSKSLPVAPSLFSANLGAYRITSIFDGMAPLSKQMFSGLPQAEIDATLAASGITGDALPVPVTAFLLQSGERTILIDAGMGEIEAFGPGFGQLWPGLAAMGVAAADVDTVVLTHAHIDHLGGLISGGTVAFPNAELIVSEIEHGFWTDPAIAAAAPEDVRGAFTLATSVFSAYQNTIRLVASGEEIAPGLRLEVSPGHTPGHGIVHIDGGDRQMLMVADTYHNTTLHFASPQIAFGFDVDTALAAESRSKIFERAAADNILIAATHGHFPGFGRVARSGEAYRFVPASWI